MENYNDIKRALAAPFDEKDIEWRVQQSGISQAGKPWAMVLAYVQARAIQNRLDDVMGIDHWRVQYEIHPNGIMANLSLRFGDEWITKQDGAPETQIESFKGGISSALKRAASVWGIGRYLYSLETNFVECSEKKMHKDDSFVKINDRNYYWACPKLPDWALPKPRQEKQTIQAHIEKTGRVPSIAPDQPTQEESKNTNISEYIIPRGKYTYRRLREIPKEDLINYVEFIKKTDATKKQEWYSEFLSEAARFLQQ